MITVDFNYGSFRPHEDLIGEVEKEGIVEFEFKEDHSLIDFSKNVLEELAFEADVQDRLIFMAVHPGLSEVYRVYFGKFQDQRGDLKEGAHIMINGQNYELQDTFDYHFILKKV
jgi:hypothetical protein